MLAAGPNALRSKAFDSQCGANMSRSYTLLLNNSMYSYKQSTPELSTLVLNESELACFEDFYSGYLRILAVIPDRNSDQYCVLSDIDSESRLCFYLSC
jgi:hypothetical protein